MEKKRGGKGVTASPGLRGVTYISPPKHLPRKAPDPPPVRLVGPVFAQGIDVLEVGLEEAEVALVGHVRVWVPADLLVGVPVGPAEVVEQETAELGGVGHVRHLADVAVVEDEVRVQQVVEPRELDVLVEPLFLGERAEGLSVCPDVSVGDAEEVW